MVEDKAQASNTVAHRRNIAAPADQFNQPIDIRLVYFAHHKAPWQMTFLVGCRIYCAGKIKNGNVPENAAKTLTILSLQETSGQGGGDDDLLRCAAPGYLCDQLAGRLASSFGVTRISR
ncbi:hypothetical protein AXK30_23525 [Escherichia coli]|nr:hypothetical protein AXK30_23525 [Escherichia coli]